MSSNVISVIEASRRLACAHLKHCPLCEALNAANNVECFVCRWHGEFDRDSLRIEEGLRRLLSRCPEFRALKQRMDAARKSLGKPLDQTA